MKRLLFLNALLMIAFYSCKKDNITHSGDFERSFYKWQVFKSTSGDTYSYQVITGSWTGYSTETTITVKQGKVTERSFLSKGYIDTSRVLTVIKEWKENENQLATHMEGAAPLTLDQIYAQAKSDWLLKRDNATTYFETENNGMISSCGYVPNGCADDCFIGIYIKYIKEL